jgi:hypothetical protein
MNLINVFWRKKSKKKNKKKQQRPMCMRAESVWERGANRVPQKFNFFW